MSRNLKIFIAVILVVGFSTQDKICKHFGFGQEKHHEDVTVESNDTEIIQNELSLNRDYFINDTVYHWDDYLMDWVVTEETYEFKTQFVNNNIKEFNSSKPIEIEWPVLMDIQYRLRYFSELDMEIYAPVFPEAIKALDGKEVLIKGFVIPFDEEQEILSLSANPYASCFFCGKASPASIISMYLKDKIKRYKLDDYKQFKGILNLNNDDPNEFYYILRNAEEQ